MNGIPALTSLSRWAAALLLSAYAGCATADQVQLPVNNRPITFVDQRSGVPVERVLVIPKYVLAKGVSAGAGHGAGAMSIKSFVAFPFLYFKGAPFSPRQPDASGLLVGSPVGLFAGRAVTIQGVIIVSPGHRSKWLWQLWDRDPNTSIPLEPLDESEDAHEVARLRMLFATSQIRGAELNDSERQLLSADASSQIEVTFTDVERRTVMEFLQTAQR